MKRAILTALTLAALFVVFPMSSTQAGSGGPAPTGVTGLSLDSSVELAWQAVSGATGYTVYRGTSASSITTLLTPSTGVSATTFTESRSFSNNSFWMRRSVSAYQVKSAPSGSR